MKLGKKFMKLNTSQSGEFYSHKFQQLTYLKRLYNVVSLFGRGGEGEEEISIGNV
jgi:hypothetical protein